MICKDFNRKDFSQHDANTRKIRKPINSLTMRFLNPTEKALVQKQENNML